MSHFESLGVTRGLPWSAQTTEDNVVDPVNQLEAEIRAGRRAGRQGRLADYMGRKDVVELDELG